MSAADAVTHGAADRSDVLARLREAVVVAVLRAPSVTAALHTVDALVAGGIRAVEITYSTPDVAAVLRAVREQHPGVLLGAGTITHPAQAAESAAAGATFLVSPGTVPDVTRAMLDTGAVVLSGALSPTEVMTAVDLGAHLVKLFPAGLGGPALLRALRGPFPHVDFCPTGGVDPGNLRDWVAAGAVAVGAGGELCPSAAVAEGRWSVITEAAVRFRQAADALPGRRP